MSLDCALGAVLYRMLTGKTYLDFDQRETPDAQADNVYRIRNQEPHLPSAHSPHVPAWLDGVVLRALAKQPEERYASAEAMREALLQQQPAPAPVVTLSATRVIPDRRPGVSASPAAVSRSVQTPKRKTSLPVWFWPAAVAAGVLFVFLIFAVASLGKDRDGGTLAGVATATDTTEAETAVATDTLAPTPKPTLRPTETDTPTSTPTDTPRPTATRTPKPTVTETPKPTATRTPRPTATHTPRPTPTSTHMPIPPTYTPKPQSLAAGATRTRSIDGMVMVYVPAGNFLMGLNDSDEYALDSLKPQHTVYLDAFWIDKIEVTNAPYRTCFDAGSCKEPGCWNDHYYNAPDQPVICVSWKQAQTYCEWAGARLPAEAEWEKAARGTDARLYPWGDQRPDCSKANFYWRSTPEGDGWCAGRPSTAGPIVGASPYGALDMAGNVREWVADWYDEDYYAASPAQNPSGPTSGRYKVIRGGSYDTTGTLIRCAHRMALPPESRDWINATGFRCAASSLP